MFLLVLRIRSTCIQARALSVASQVQHSLPLHDDEHLDRPCLLPPAGLGGEDRPRGHGTTRLLGFHAGHRGKNARDFGIYTSHRYYKGCKGII